MMMVVVMVWIELNFDQLGRPGRGFSVSKLQPLDGIGDRLQQLGVGGDDGDGAGLRGWRRGQCWAPG
jgi:hypothetical protein